MLPGTTAEDALQESRDVFLTNGEWELADLQIVGVNLLVGKAEYSQVKYFVSIYPKTTSSKNIQYESLHTD